MANNILVELDPFKRGDTANFQFSFSNPYVGFNWSTVTLDGAMTDVSAPTDNTGAGAVRLNQVLTTNAQGAYYNFTLTPTESKALDIATYKVECQIKQGGIAVATPTTAKVQVLQDYVV